MPHTKLIRIDSDWTSQSIFWLVEFIPYGLLLAKESRSNKRLTNFRKVFYSIELKWDSACMHAYAWMSEWFFSFVLVNIWLLNFLCFVIQLNCILKYKWVALRLTWKPIWTKTKKMKKEKQIYNKYSWDIQ